MGLDNYSRHESTQILMLAWAFDHEDVDIWFPHLGPPPERLVKGMRNPKIKKVAWSASFEHNITKHKLGRQYPTADGQHWFVPLNEWRDPIVLAHNLSLPGYLEDVANILKMEQRKDQRGDELKKMFCGPVSKGGEQTLFGIAPPLFRDWESRPKEWAEFAEYCKQDVRAERDLWYRMLKVPLPERDWDGWVLDQKINEYGMPGRRDLAQKALRIALRYIQDQRALLKTMTGLENPNSDSQFKGWITPLGYSWNSLRKEYVQAELDNKESKLTPEARAALIVRREARKSSYTKLERFLSVLCTVDDRLRYQFKYMAAARTGRWSGGDVQVQNLPRGEKAVKKNLKRALRLLEAEDYDTIKKEFYDDAKPKDRVTPLAFVITLLRSMFQAKPGKKIVVADLNAIENRALGWVAGCWDILEVFALGRCPYMSFGSRMFKIPYEDWIVIEPDGKHKPKDEHFEELRQQSKPAVLGAGYGLGGGKLKKNEYGDEVRGGLWGYAKNVCGVDISQEFAANSVKMFREAYPEVVQLWTDLEEAFKQVLKKGGCIEVGNVTWDSKRKEWVDHPTLKHEHFKDGNHCVIKFRRKKMESGGWLMRMELPSGRGLHYLNCTLEEEKRTSEKTGNEYTVEQIYYDGIEHSATTDASGQQAKKNHVWGRTKTYGGKLTENAVQAISRDILLNGMFEADAMGFNIFGLFHDELANEVDDTFDGLTVKDLVWCMSEVPEWAPGLLLGAEGYEGKWYKKG